MKIYWIKSRNSRTLIYLEAGRCFNRFISKGSRPRVNLTKGLDKISQKIMNPRVDFMNSYNKYVI